MTQSKLGFEQPEAKFSNWREGLRQSWKDYLVDTLGLPVSVALERAEEEINGIQAKQHCDRLESAAKMKFKDKKVLDLGSGHGGMALEIAKRGGNVFGLEPCKPWRIIAQERAKELSLDNKVQFLDGNAEELPFETNSFDYIVSLQVLEHVASPRKVIEEIKRVLHPQGMAYISCENYLAFREQHYRLPWLPLLPKSIASLYLKLNNRDPQFLNEHVIYTTCPQLIWDFLNVGLWSEYWPKKYQKDNVFLCYLLLLLSQRRTLFKVGFSHLFKHRANWN